MKDKGIYLTTLFWFALTLNVAAEPAVENKIIKFVNYNYHLDTAKTVTEIERFSIPVTLESYDSLHIICLSDSPPRGTLPLLVEYFKDGDRVGQSQARVKISHFENVLTAVSRIKRGECLCPEQFSLQRKEVTSLTEKPLTSFESLVEKIAIRNINIGQILLENMLEPTPDIKQGQDIQIRYQSGGITVAVTGIALSDGHIGETIKVRNKQSGKTIRCIVVDSESVATAKL